MVRNVCRRRFPLFFSRYFLIIMSHGCGRRRHCILRCFLYWRRPLSSSSCEVRAGDGKNSSASKELMAQTRHYTTWLENCSPFSFFFFYAVLLYKHAMTLSSYQVYFFFRIKPPDKTVYWAFYFHSDISLGRNFIMHPNDAVRWVVISSRSPPPFYELIAAWNHLKQTRYAQLWLASLLHDRFAFNWCRDALTKTAEPR